MIQFTESPDCTEPETRRLQIETEIETRFLPKHQRSVKLSEVYNRIGFDSRAVRVYLCGTALDFRIPEESEETPKLYRANFCKDRLCAMCGWRRSLKVFGQVSRIMDAIQNEYRFLFVTFTVRSCSAETAQGHD